MKHETPVVSAEDLNSIALESAELTNEVTADACECGDCDIGD